MSEYIASWQCIEVQRLEVQWTAKIAKAAARSGGSS
jgi:hypothetical protein